MEKRHFRQSGGGLKSVRRYLMLGAAAIGLGISAAEPPPARQVSAQPDKDGVVKVHLIQDDAQDYMVSKIYYLKYAQANDLQPFIMGIVMRYNMNSSVNTIEYGANNSQILTVTCPIKMMPYVDDFVAKADRNIMIDGKVPGEIIKGTGITRAVYRPKFRSGQNLLNVLVNTVIGEGPWSSVYAWDSNSNQIYWKDNSSNTQYVYQFLGYLDRPAPQISLDFTIHEVRESAMRDIGIEYLAWKNGPGLDIFQTAWKSFSVSSAGTAAMQAMSGPVGGFLFAPQFDASFIRFLEQSGKAEIKNNASLTVSNSESNSYEIYFNPEFQNIIKTNNDQTSVITSSLTGINQVYLKIIQPLVNLHYGSSQSGYPATEAFEVANYTPGTYTKYNGTLNFGFDLQTANVVERNNLGAELIETTQLQSNMLIPLNKEIIIGQWERVQDIKQTIGVPWLMNIPYLGYLFSTVTTNKETSRVYLTVTASMLNTAKPGVIPGELLQLSRKRSK